jgi:hypothetical protein
LPEIIRSFRLFQREPVEFDRCFSTAGIPIHLSQCDVAPRGQRAIKRSSAEDGFSARDGNLVAAHVLEQFRKQCVSSRLLLRWGALACQKGSKSLNIPTRIN